MEWELWIDATDDDGMRLITVKIDVDTLLKMTEQFLRCATCVRIELKKREIHVQPANPNR